MKRFFVLLLAVLMMFGGTFSAYADLATSSDWIMDDDVIDEDIEFYDYEPLFAPFSIAPLSSGDDVKNTVDLTKVSFGISYYDMTNKVIYKTKQLDSSGEFIFSRPSDFVKSNDLEIRLKKGALPSSGKYRVDFMFSSHVGGMSYRSPYIVTYKTSANVARQQSSSTVQNFSQFSGNFQGSFTIDLGSIDDLYLVVKLDNLSFPYGGVVKFSFTKLSSSAQTDMGSAGGSYSSEDAANDTANNTAQIAQGMSDANDTLKEIIQTISNQLAALWDQMYNYMHLRQLANDDKNTNALIDNQNNNNETLIEENRNNTDDIIDALDNNSSTIIDNNNQNTDTIVNGYDSSKLDNSSNQLNDTLTQYDDLENSISESMGSYFNDFEYTNIADYPSGVLSSLLFFGNYLQKIFESIANFNLSITLGLTITFVLMLIGYYRYGR